MNALTCSSIQPPRRAGGRRGYSARQRPGLKRDE
jgi:hypothetical protein